MPQFSGRKKFRIQRLRFDRPGQVDPMRLGKWAMAGHGPMEHAEGI
jgi:hypothetical protein